MGSELVSQIMLYYPVIQTAPVLVIFITHCISKMKMAQDQGARTLLTGPTTGAHTAYMK